ncbi:hypothetical protein CEE34_04160 [Candidatus Aerophobetes bacterium Ae_b3a]|nr:MAG: hypothetical protein CEE34_04160 [Candidatus Aerophobetes bacterium Ae_b3a]
MGTDESLGASVSFLDYDGIVLFAGAFEKANQGPHGHIYIECIATSDLDLRQRELVTALRGEKFIIFLVPGISRGSYGQSRVTETVLFRRILQSFNISWDNYKTPVSHAESKIPEFQPYVERFGSAYVHYSMSSDRREHVKVICGDSNLFAITFFDKLFFLPCTNPSTHKQAIGAAVAAAKAVIAYRKRISKAKPQWISEFRFTQENSLINDAKELQQQLNQIETKIDSYGNYKGVLCYHSDPLVDIVTNIFEKFFGIRLVKEDEFVEDAAMFSNPDEEIYGYTMGGTYFWAPASIFYAMGGEVTDSGITTATGYINGEKSVAAYQALVDMYRDESLSPLLLGGGGIGVFEGLATGKNSYAVVNASQSMIDKISESGIEQEIEASPQVQKVKKNIEAKQ